MPAEGERCDWNLGRLIDVEAVMAGQPILTEREEGEHPPLLVDLAFRAGGRMGPSHGACWTGCLRSAG